MLTRNASWPGPNHGTRIQKVQPRSPGEQLLDDIESFGKSLGISPRQVCLRAGVNESLIPRLRDDFIARADIERKERYFMRDGRA